MLTVAYLANQFPSPVEPYVMDEIEELRRQGVDVIAGSVRRPDKGAPSTGQPDRDADFVVLQPVHIALAVRASWLCLRRWRRIRDLVRRVILQGREAPLQRLKALLHTWLGACYALSLEDRGVKHIHAHHGYFGSWIAMVAARLLNVKYSLTLHGSDLLTHAAYLDVKLQHCRFCVTISEYNRRHILEHYPTIDAENVVVARLGVVLPEPANFPFAITPELKVHTVGVRRASKSVFHLLAIGRLHAVKDHGFLLRACAQLCQSVLDFQCEIAGEGPERQKLERWIREYHLSDRVRLLGHVPHEEHNVLYARADVVVLTSRSEGIPLVLMEAMARGKIVLAPEITGIPELVVDGETGFLYQPGSLQDFVARLLWLRTLTSAHRFTGDLPGVHDAGQLGWVGQQAREQVRQHFNRTRNLQNFSNLFLDRITGASENAAHEDPVLQQI